jgi:hypothetical protein
VLALWLVHGYNGAELARVTQLSTPTIHDRLVDALVHFLPRRDIARRTQDGRAAFRQWLGQQLRLSPDPLPDSIPPTLTAPWQHALGRVRELLLVAVGRQHLPATVRDVIDVALLARADEPPAWQQKTSYLALAALLLVVDWILLRPTMLAPAAQTSPSTGTQAQPADARTLVAHALDAWTTLPLSDTLHRRVWAVDERPSARDQVHITDVWLASDTPHYRVETTRDGTLIEWHVVDSRDQLHITADAPFHMCHWSYGARFVPPRAQMFTVPPDHVRAIRDARLRSGSYGAGYRMLRRALQAPDLRSYGGRTDGERVLVTLSFRDEGASYTQKVLGVGPDAPARTVVLLLDGRTYELQAVRELVGDAAQTSARDLWRVDMEETLPAVPAAVPPVPGEAIVANAVIDPACPGLDRDTVGSARATIAPVPQSFSRHGRR